MTKITRTKVNHADSVANYPRGCDMCGHDVAFISNALADTRSEADCARSPREAPEVGPHNYALCPGCALGGGTPCVDDCRVCVEDFRIFNSSLDTVW